MALNYEKYMNQALIAAAKGWGNVSPNPMVGAVIVKRGSVIGEGFHAGPGKDHAEVAAIKSAACDLKGADLIVTMEPCCHHGRTPPCTDAIIKSGLRRVVYGMTDPNPLVNGKGLAALKAAGIEVKGPVLEKESVSLNRIYINWIKTGRPYVISKVAISLDGKIAVESGNSKWITGEKCRRRIHYWRAGVDAVLVGSGTVRTDDPLLTARDVGEVKQPRPIIITNSGKFGPDRKIMKRNPLIICGEKEIAERLQSEGMDVIIVSQSGKKGSWKYILTELGKRGITSVMIEGGGTVHSQIMEEALSDYMVASLSTKLIGESGRSWLPGWKVDDVQSTPKLVPDQILVLDENIVVEGALDYQAKTME